MPRKGSAAPAGARDPRREAMLEVLALFRVLVRAIREHYRHVEERASLGGAQLWALSEVAAADGLSIGELARRLAIHISTASNLVGRLEELGLVERARGPGDQRVVRVAATEAGRRTLRGAPQPSMGLLQHALLGMPPTRLRALRRELTEVLAHMQQPGEAHEAARELPIAELLGTGERARARVNAKAASRGRKASRP
jgi:MarR family transcriptional regulator, organic hydroperoxide resistance regulator